MIQQNRPSNWIRRKRQALENYLTENVLIKRKIKKYRSINEKKNTFRANLFINDFRKKIQYEIDQKRISHQQGKFYIPDHARIFFVIRIKGINDINPQNKKILKLMRLNQVNNGVFVKINSSTIEMIKKVEPYIAYGYPSVSNVRELLKKRGFGKIGKRGSWQRIFLSGNKVIQNNLGLFGINCLEDLVQELFTCGPRFKEVNSFLWPFKLRSPRRGYMKIGKKKHISEKGAYGNWESSINDLIVKMN